MFFDQEPWAVRCEWGEAAVRQLAPWCAAVVIVDVLSFSTCVDVAVSRGAGVLPYRWRDDSAAEFARERGALLASPERRFAGGYSLSPTSLTTLPSGARLVLPSPNGATLSALAAESGAAVFAACLRNVQAVADHLRPRFPSVLVVPAGERWPDGSLRPALEDWLGAGALVRALGLAASPEAEAAARAWDAMTDLPAPLRACASGRELIERGFVPDLDVAAGLNVSHAVPELRNGVYLEAVTPC